ncbi:hypothetical protein D3C80_934240 [compost metagenome]
MRPVNHDGIRHWPKVATFAGHDNRAEMLEGCCVIGGSGGDVALAAVSSFSFELRLLIRRLHLLQ